MVDQNHVIVKQRTKDKLFFKGVAVECDEHLSVIGAPALVWSDINVQYHSDVLYSFLLIIGKSFSFKEVVQFREKLSVKSGKQR